MRQIKTNAIRALDAKKIPNVVHTYDPDEGIDGNTVARLIGQSEDKVFKTLVTHFEREHFVFVIPVNEELNLKKAAKAAGVKNIQMIPHADLLKTTGYMKGGCSPLGMKKAFKTFIHKSAQDMETFIVNAGKRGTQIELNANDLASLIDAEFVDLV